MRKDFDEWNKDKKRLHKGNGKAYAYPREVWWCALGLNIGAEIDGKNENFERTVLVLRVYNKETLLVLPITSKEKCDAFHYKITSGSRTIWVKLTQMRVISNLRLLRKVDVISVGEFDKVKNALRVYL